MHHFIVLNFSPHPSTSHHLSPQRAWITPYASKTKWLGKDTFATIVRSLCVGSRTESGSSICQWNLRHRRHCKRLGSPPTAFFAVGSASNQQHEKAYGIWAAAEIETHPFDGPEKQASRILSKNETLLRWLGELRHWTTRTCWTCRAWTWKSWGPWHNWPGKRLPQEDWV